MLHITLFCCITILGNASLLSVEKHPVLRFSAMGCGPYSDKDAAAIAYYIKQENKEKKSQFLVHLGDINSGDLARQGKLTETNYSKMKQLLTCNNKIPTYIVPGDNEWNDRPDPDLGWTHWTKHLGSLENNFPTNWVTQRQEIRTENFAFICNCILVIGINLTGGRIHDHNEWARRFRENNDWINHQFNTNQENTLAAIVCCQANVIGQGNVKALVNLLFIPFRHRFEKSASAFNKPILFLHADGHKWIIDKPWKGAQNVTRVQVDRINAHFPPVQITVNLNNKNPFSFNRRLKTTNWLLPTQRPAYAYCARVLPNFP